MRRARKCLNYRFHYREIDGEGYMVVINVAGSEERVDLSAFPTPTRELTVATAAPNSRFDVG
jgi:hypothetical protein